MQKFECICKNKKGILIYSGTDVRYFTNNQKFNIIKCDNCNLVSLHPKPNITEIGKYYPSSFFDRGEKSNNSLKKRKEFRKNNAKLKFVEKALGIKKNARILDVGSANGDFLNFLQENGYKNIEGVELSKDAADFARKKFKLKINNTDFLSSNLKNNSFDLITFWAVFEHLYDPDKIISKINKILKKNGKVIILVPNFNSPLVKTFHDFDIPRHLYQYTIKTLENLLKDEKFKIITSTCFTKGTYTSEIRILPFIVRQIKKIFGINEYYLINKQTNNKKANFLQTIKKISEIIEFILLYIPSIFLKIIKRGSVFIIIAEKK